LFRSVSIVASLAASAVGCAAEMGGGGDSTSPSIEGRLELVMVGDGVTSHAEYFLSTPARGDRWLRLDFAAHPELTGVHDTGNGEAHFHRPGDTNVRLQGDYLDEDTLAVTALEDTQPDDQGGVAIVRGALIAPTPKKVAIILANFTDDASQPLTQDGARALVFGAATSTNAYYQEQSFGARSLTGIQRADGDVFGWFPINASRTTCDYVGWGNLARAAAQAAGVNLTGYAHVIHYFPRSPNCGWSGVGQLPGRYTWINGSSSSTIAHELGHNFGVHHASSLTCLDSAGARVSISGSCTSSEYGDPYDVMGRGYRHMNAYQKGRLGFLEAANTVTAPAGGTFTIAPLEQKATGAQVLRIPIRATAPPLYYYVEFRQPSVFDAFAAGSPAITGVIIHRSPDYATLARTQLIDLTPATTSFNDAPLAVGRTFTDGVAAIAITLTALTPAGATVQVVQ
jgi:hypothetical protein